MREDEPAVRGEHFYPVPRLLRNSRQPGAGGHLRPGTLPLRSNAGRGDA
eukprot:CAMPEP_0179336762 /NCGR_PEP_ID=MMETSP0797-20121207/67231_1 /TAXON_ID=47934 /ORGANISM="Dinophysis acuminata, Strain DAEP01" /LENGTH=48 /DNA_ID= /DNA_START= /DNA_END= /DNA_ORIENTATION=